MLAEARPCHPCEADRDQQGNNHREGQGFVDRPSVCDLPEAVALTGSDPDEQAGT